MKLWLGLFALIVAGSGGGSTNVSTLGGTAYTSSYLGGNAPPVDAPQSPWTEQCYSGFESGQYLSYGVTPEERWQRDILPCLTYGPPVDRRDLLR